MAKTDPHNLDGSLDASDRDVADVRAAATAYTTDNAADYDAIRTLKPHTKRIHDFERDILLWALGHTTKDADILEVGCGTGRLLAEGLDAGYLIDGLDGSGPMLEHLKAKLNDHQRENMKLIVGQAAEVPLPDASYDLVYCVRLLNQTESPEYALTVIDDMARLTKPGGYFLVECVNASRTWLRSKKRTTTALTPAQMAKRGEAAGGKAIAYRSAFLLSMSAYFHCPGFLLGLLAMLDRTFSRLLPRLGSRVYVLFRKDGASV